MVIDKKVFNKVYAKYQRKDYFMDKLHIRNRTEEAKKLDIILTYAMIKQFKEKQKAKNYTGMIDRVKEYLDGKKYPKHQKFTWDIIKALNI